MKWLIAGLVVAWLVLRQLGGVESLGILSGTVVASETQLVLAVSFVLAWLGVVLVAPVLVLALAVGGIMGVWNRWRSSKAP